jgi:hypothetical protein
MGASSSSHLPDEADSIICDCFGEAKAQLKQEGETFDTVRHVGIPSMINPSCIYVSYISPFYAFY